MKILYATLLLLFLNSCSFDNKTGIWDGNDLRKKAKKRRVFN